MYKELGVGTVKLTGSRCEAVGFSLMDKYKQENYPTALDIVGKLSYHYFMGKAVPQIEMIDFKGIKKPIQNTELKKSMIDILKLNGLA